MIKIYHNPKCSKSRAGVCLLEEQQIPFETIKYLDTPLEKKEIEQIIKLLGVAPIALVRQKEAIWIENFKNKQLTDDQIITALSTYPKLIERPIVINGNKAVIARPTERINEIL